MCERAHGVLAIRGQIGSPIQGDVIHYLSESDIEQLQGVRVTRPLRTVLDLLQTDHVDRNLIRQAIDEAMRRGLITGKQIDSLPHDRLRNSFRELAGQLR